MHLVVSHAGSPAPAAGQAPSAQQAPHLHRLLGAMEIVAKDTGDELSLSAPHERMLARALGWELADGLLPLAARWAERDGLAPAPAGEGWGLLSPTHWHLGTEQVSLTDPAVLDLQEPEARALFEAVSSLFVDEGWSLHWGAPTRWYARHPSLLSLPTASLDRVVGRNVDLWLTSQIASRPIRRLQAEAQMLLHRHPVNEAREAQGRLAVNSFWLSGTGPHLASQSASDAAKPSAALPPDTLTLAEQLRAPTLAGDPAAWLAAWAELDAGPLRELLRELLALVQSPAGGADVRLTLCGERHALTLAPAARAWWQRGPLAPRGPALASLLNEL